MTIGGNVQLGLCVTEWSGRVVVAVEGEVDFSNASELRNCLFELYQAGSRHVIIDLQGTAFLDSSGLGVLVGGLKRFTQSEGDFCLVCTQRRILKILEITGLAQVFTIYPSVSAAVAAPVPQAW